MSVKCNNKTCDCSHVPHAVATQTCIGRDSWYFWRFQARKVYESQWTIFCQSLDSAYHTFVIYLISFMNLRCSLCNERNILGLLPGRSAKANSSIFTVWNKSTYKRLNHLKKNPDKTLLSNPKFHIHVINKEFHNVRAWFLSELQVTFVFILDKLSWTWSPRLVIYVQLIKEDRFFLSLPCGQVALVSLPEIAKRQANHCSPLFV